MDRKLFSLILLVSLLPQEVRAEKLALDTTNFAEEAVALWKEELPNIRLAEEDVKVPRGWPPDFTIKPVEDLFNQPFQTPRLASNWVSKLKGASTLRDILRLSSEILFESKNFEAENTPPFVPPVPPTIPAELEKALKTLYPALVQSQTHLKLAVDSLSLDQRKAFLNFMEIPAENGIIKQEISSRRIRKMIEGMKDFKEEELFKGGSALFTALEKVLPLIEDLSKSKFNPEHQITWTTPIGDILISGKGNDSYSEGELRKNLVLIDLGGDNFYSGPAAGAMENQIRLVIDMGRNLNFETRRFTNSTVASGIFGIGLMFLPNPEGTKKINSYSFSQGSGIAGIGGLFLKGRADLKSDRYSQGVGAFGLGILKIEDGSGSTFELTRNGQGAGFVRGVGIFSSSGDAITIKGGLVQPDPREPLGTVSICQGMGYGHRGYAGGGVGIMALTGNGLQVEGSYFVQGCGYWHSMGIFHLEGNKSQVQARRYDQGSGVHYAFGHFQLKGDKNRILNWGVGPAFGWDRGEGVALFDGDDNEIQVEWGAGTAAIGSWSLSYIRGNGNLLQIPQWGDGGFYRNECAYSLHILDGEKNLAKSPRPFEPKTDALRVMGTPWGVFRSRGLSFQTDLKLKAPEWTRLSIEDAFEREMTDLKGELGKSTSETGLEKVAGLVDVAAAFSLDKDNPRRAIEELITLPKNEIRYLVDVYDPVAVDQLLKIRVALAAHGELSAEAILDRIETFPLQKKANLLSELAGLPPSNTISHLIKQMKKAPDEQIRIGATRILGQMLNEDTGREPGIRAVLKALSHHLKDKKRVENQPRNLLSLLEKLMVSEAFGVLSTSLELSKEQKLRFLSQAPEDVTISLGAPGAKEFVKLINENAASARKRVNEELKLLNNIEPVVRENLYELLLSTGTRKIQSALIALGQLANPQDAPYLKPFLHHREAAVREAAAAALGRMGEAGLPFLKTTMESISTMTRNLVVASLPYAVITDSADLIFMGLEDSEPMVRLTAVSALKNLPPVFESSKEEIIRKAKTKLANETDPSVLFAIQSIK